MCRAGGKGRRHEAAEARRHWQTALEIAKELEASGRLAPTDAYFVATIEQRLAQVSQAAARWQGRSRLVGPRVKPEDDKGRGPVPASAASGIPAPCR
jgi:hypothetical protein